MPKAYYAISMLVAFCSIALAQSPTTEQGETPVVQQESGTGTAQGTELRESASPSVIDGILNNTATHLGFAFSSYEMYTTDAVRGVPGNRLTATMFYPQIFTNFRGKGSQFHLDYSVGYRIYQQQRGLNTAAHSGTMTWDLRLAHSTYFQLSDSFTSSPNDYGFMLGQPGQLSLLSQIQIQPIYTQDILVNRQRLVRNSLTATVSQRVGKKTRVSLFGSYDYLQYRKASFSNTQGFQVGVRLEYQFKKWLFLDSSYSTYVNAVDNALRSSTIHRLQVGGFRFQISPTIQLFTMGTVEYSHYLGAGHTVAGAEAGLARISKSNSILLAYHHGLSTALGPGAILEGDDVTLAFRQRLSSRFTLLMDAAYMQGAGFIRGASMRSGSGFGGIQMGVERNLVASVNVGYASQHLSGELPFSAPNLRRYTAYVGLQYFMPALRGR